MRRAVGGGGAGAVLGIMTVWGSRNAVTRSERIASGGRCTPRCAPGARGQRLPSRSPDSVPCPRCATPRPPGRPRSKPSSASPRTTGQPRDLRSKGVLHTLEGSRYAVACEPGEDLDRTRKTLELDHVIGAVFGFLGSRAPRGSPVPTTSADEAADPGAQDGSPDGQGRGEQEDSWATRGAGVPLTRRDELSHGVHVGFRPKVMATVLPWFKAGLDSQRSESLRVNTDLACHLGGLQDLVFAHLSHCTCHLSRRRKKLADLGRVLRARCRGSDGVHGSAPGRSPRWKSNVEKHRPSARSRR